MKILIATSFDYPHEGGLSTHVSTLKSGLEKRGHLVDVLSFSNYHPLIKKTYAQAPGFFLNKFQKGRGQLFNDSQRLRLLYQRLKRIAPSYDVINTQDVFATLAASKTNVPVIATVHGYYAFEAVSRGAIAEDSPVYYQYLDLEKNAYHTATANVTVDERINQYIERQCENSTRFTIKNFIDVDMFKQINPTSQSKILFVPRRLTEKNGVIYPLYALKKILYQFPETKLVYAGSGEEMPKMKKYIKTNQLDNHVTLLGSVPHHTMLDWYQKADITIIPSIHSHGVEEATSIAALEAMASGTPVIASAIGGLKQIITNEQDGLLVEEKNVDQLTDAVEKLFTNPELSIKLAENARKKIIESYSHLSAAERFEEIYRTALNKATS